IPDFAMPKYFRLVTRWTPSEIQAIEQAMASGKLHPRDAKMKLAREVTAIFHGDEAAAAAEEAFIRIFQQREMPHEMEVFTFHPEQTVLDVLVEAKLVGSRSEGRRLIDQKGVRLDGQVLDRADMPIPHEGVLQVGKRRFVQLRLQGD
ncbi:MAG: S4 domain-containing protein, partial [Anaerolineales bacterium]